MIVLITYSNVTKSQLLDLLIKSGRRRIHVSVLRFSVLEVLRSGVHDMKPERRKDSKKDHSSITSWHLRRLFEAAKDLISSCCIGVMVAVPLQLEEEVVCDPCIGIP